MADTNNGANGLVPSGTGTDKPSTTTPGGIKIGLRTGVAGPAGSLRANLAAATDAKREREAREAAEREADIHDAPTKKNRLALMLDLSGSMHSASGIDDATPRIEHLRTAYGEFIKSVTLDDTSVAVRTFPPNDFPLVLTSHQPTLWAYGMQLVAGGGTPMGSAMCDVLDTVPLTRGILISDGGATDNFNSRIQEHICPSYCEAEVPVDCVHIGPSDDGEELLKQIAAITGGIYLKFKDVSSFAKALHYLTPRHRGLLTGGNAGELASAMGADEVILPKGGE